MLINNVFLQDLKELARELGAPAGGKKDELVGAILAAQGIPDAAGGAEELDDGLADDVIDSTGSAGAPDGSAAAPPAAAAAEGKHASIVFALDKQQVWTVIMVSGAPEPPAGNVSVVA